MAVALLKGEGFKIMVERSLYYLLKRGIYTFVCLITLIAFLNSLGCSSVETGSVIRKHDGELVKARDTEELPEGEKLKLRQNLVKEVREGLMKYRLSPGDMLEVMYHISLVSEAQDYRLGINDEINVDFYYHPQLNRTVVVRPDGKITLPIKGDFAAAGLKPTELALVIKKTYSDILNEPVVTVSVNKYSSKIFELQKAITNAPRGQAKLVTIGPDGNVYLPMLKGIKASGKTIDELRDLINNEYRYEFNNLSVSILIERIVGNRIFIFGEIQRPGPIPVDKPMTIMQAVAASGGVLPTGSLEYVKLMYWNEKNEPILRTVNLLNIMNNLKIEDDMIVPNNSVIFVPKTTIAKMNQWVDQYIRQLFLWQGESLGFSYGLGGRTYATTTID
ncbi:MAG TPA: polysaccharide biosynthesis/export family protein [Syntrophorhabdaceae bacterium]|nr:polysaccharide biosynthesis/export family protein [Syntrophorhabdaceae bacterium]HQK47032.1 polysaccharide biosynthesis/export family protein [Syntrophorhabdaceae bacterium]HRR72288.1 polysaccharide biosynthesis/export family protein [Syntrophorhabdaceae bacterium]